MPELTLSEKPGPVSVDEDDGPYVLPTAKETNIPTMVMVWLGMFSAFLFGGAIALYKVMVGAWSTDNVEVAFFVMVGGLVVVLAVITAIRRWG